MKTGESGQVAGLGRGVVLWETVRLPQSFLHVVKANKSIQLSSFFSHNCGVAYSLLTNSSNTPPEAAILSMILLAARSDVPIDPPHKEAVAVYTQITLITLIIGLLPLYARARLGDFNCAPL